MAYPQSAGGFPFASSASAIPNGGFNWFNSARSPLFLNQTAEYSRFDGVEDKIHTDNIKQKTKSEHR